jgi:hypothetical protein
MKLKIVIVDLEIPPRVKRWGVQVGIPVVALGIAAVAYAGTPLHSWGSAELLTANDLNGNFSNLQGQITALQSGVTALQAFQTQATSNGAYSLGATYCGATAPTQGAFSGPGQWTGYASARVQCEAVSGCSATASHMCTTEELIRTKQLGGAITTGGWYSSALIGDYSTTASVDDCVQWTSVTAANLGSTWDPALGPSWDFCSRSGGHTILCCN